MSEIQINLDEPIWQYGFVNINRTILFTWGVMALLAALSWLVTRRITSGVNFGRGQNLLEVLVSGLRGQIREVTQQDPGPFLPFVGTLFVFIAMSNLMSIIPWYEAPTSSFTTTAALATCVFFAVPVFGIASDGVPAYLRQYIQPSVLMLPFNIIGELSRTLALAVRLYGNMMSGTIVAAILLGFLPLFVPVLMQLLGLLTGMIQAYIFAILATVYIASAIEIHHKPATDDSANQQTPSPSQKGT